MPRSPRTHPSSASADGATVNASQNGPAQDGQPKYKGADLDEATPDKAAQRETEIIEVGGEVEIPRPNI